MIALIDFDLVVYRCAASAENEEFHIAKSRVEDLLDNIIIKTEADSYIGYLTGASSFRKSIYPEYKANRTQPKPKWLSDLRQYAVDSLGVVVAKEGLEADDELGINQTHDTVICSLDKDLLQIAGHHFQWSIGTLKWSKPDIYITQTELEGWRRFYQQCLKGDKSDNIKGIGGIGEKKAEKLLAKCTTDKEMFDVVREMYGNDDEFKMNASCLYILRSYDDSFDKVFERNVSGNNSDETHNSDDN